MILKLLKNALDENDFILTGTIVNRSFVKCCLLKVSLLNNCDIYCFVRNVVVTPFYEIKDSFVKVLLLKMYLVYAIFFRVLPLQMSFLESVLLKNRFHFICILDFAHFCCVISLCSSSFSAFL